MEQSIEQIISGCRNKDEKAIHQLVTEYQARIFKLALSILDDPSEANDVTQETFISALASIDRYEHRKSFKAWLFTITMNICRSRLRKRKTVSQLKDILQIILRLDKDPTRSPEEKMLQNEKENALWNALSKLDEKHRTTILLRYYHNLTVMEISQILSVNEGTVHSRLHNARIKLKALLKNYYGEPHE